MNNNHLTHASSLLTEFLKEIENAGFRFKAGRGGFFSGSKLFMEFVSIPGGDTAYSPNGLLVASGNGEGKIKIYDVQIDSLAREFQAHTGNVRSVSFSPDGRLLVSGSDDHAVKIWDVETGELIRSCFGHQSSVTFVRFLPDGHRVISQSRAGTINIWDVQTGELKLDHCQDEWDADAVSFSPDCYLCVSVGDDHVIKIWDMETGELKHACCGHEDTVTSVSFSPDARRIASGSEDHTVKVWDLETGQLLHDCRGHREYVTSVAFSPDGRQVVSGSWDKTLKIWDAETGERIQDFHGHESGVNAVSFSPDSRCIASGGNDQTVKIWDIQTGELLHDCRGHEDWVRSVRFTPDAFRVISGDDASRVMLWDIGTGQFLFDFTKRKYCENRLSVKLNLLEVPKGSEKAEVNIDTPCQVSIADFEGTKICLTTDRFEQKPKYKLTFDRFGSAKLATSVPVDSVVSVNVPSNIPMISLGGSATFSIPDVNTSHAALQAASLSCDDGRDEEKPKVSIEMLYDSIPLNITITPTKDDINKCVLEIEAETEELVNHTIEFNLKGQRFTGKFSNEHDYVFCNGYIDLVFAELENEITINNLRIWR